MGGHKRKLLPLSKAAWAAGCLAAALAACALFPAAHRQAGAFSKSFGIPARGANHGSQTPVAWPQGTVDVNTANGDALEALAGIGPKLAEAILAEREANGPFDYPEDLVMVRGIGVKTLARFFAQLDFSARGAEP